MKILLFIIWLPCMVFSQNEKTFLSHVKIEPSLALGLNLSGPSYYADDDKTIYAKIEVGYDFKRIQLRAIYQGDILEDVSMAFFQGGYNILKNDNDFAIVPYIGIGEYFSVYHQRRNKQWMLSYGSSFYYKKFKLSINKNDLMNLLYCTDDCRIGYINVSLGVSFSIVNKSAKTQ